MKSSYFYRKSIKEWLYILPILLLLCFALCISSYAQNLASGSISINSNPQGAKIYLDNTYKGLTPLKLTNITLGQHNLKLVLSGYQEWNSYVSVIPVLTVNISADLIAQPANGSISVSSNPQGAEVYLDNTYKGLTPLNLNNITLGQHSIKLVLSGYQEWTSDISVLPSQIARVSADLIAQPAYGSISVNSTPQGADIYLDDVYEGLTPLKLKNITTGQHSVKLVLSGYPNWVGSISVLPNQVATVSANLKSQPAYGSVSISSNPQGAKVYLDNISKGNTPLNLKNITTGQHSVKLVLSGYQDWTSNISVLPSQIAKVSTDLILQPTYGSISISCDQSGAKIFLNGTYQKATTIDPVILENVKSGNYELAIIKDNFRVWVEDVEVYFDEVSSVEVTMTEIFN